MTKKPGDLAPSDPDNKALERALSHPVVKQMHARLSMIQSLLEELPEAVGRAVREAIASRPPSNASGPPVKLVEAKDIEITARGIRADGKRYRMDPPPDKRKKRRR